MKLCIHQPRGVRCFFQTKTRWTAPGQDRRGQDVVGELGPNGSGGGFKLQVLCFVAGG